VETQKSQRRSWEFQVLSEAAHSFLGPSEVHFKARLQHSRLPSFQTRGWQFYHACWSRGTGATHGAGSTSLLSVHENQVAANVTAMSGRTEFMLPLI
jgi:hypothetical protein